MKCSQKPYMRNNYPGGGKDCIKMIEDRIKDELNNYCVECGEEKPEYISINNGVFLCGECIQNHLKLPQEISTIIKNDLESLTLSEIQYIYCGGNKNLLNFINEEFPKLTEFPPNLLYKTQAMYYYRKRLKYFIKGGSEPEKPLIQQGYKIIENIEPNEFYEDSLCTTIVKNNNINNFSFNKSFEKTQNFQNYNERLRKNSNNNIPNDYNINTDPNNNKKNNIFLKSKPTCGNLRSYLKYNEKVLDNSPNYQYNNQNQINNSPQKIKINIKINNKNFENNNNNRYQYNSKKEIPMQTFKNQSKIYRKPILALSPKQTKINIKHNLLKERTSSVDLLKPKINLNPESCDENNENKKYINEYISDKSSNYLENLQNSVNQKINISSLSNSIVIHTKKLAKSNQKIFNSPSEIGFENQKDKINNKDNKTDTKFSSDENNNSKAYEKILNLEELQVIPKKKNDLDDEEKITDEEVMNIFAEFEKIPKKISLKTKVNESAMSDSEIKTKKEKNEILKKLLQSKKSKNLDKSMSDEFFDKNIIDEKNASADEWNNVEYKKNKNKLKEEKLKEDNTKVIKETVREFIEEKENVKNEKTPIKEEVLKEKESSEKKENLTEKNSENEEKKDEEVTKKNKTHKVRDIFSPIVPSKFFNLFNAYENKSKNKSPGIEGNMKATKEKKNETVILNPRRKYYKEKKEKQKNNINKIISNEKENEEKKGKEIVEIPNNIRRRERENEKEREREKERENIRMKREYRLNRSKDNINMNGEKSLSIIETKKNIQKSPIITKNSREIITLSHYSKNRKYDSGKQCDDINIKENYKKEEITKGEEKNENKNLSIRNKYKQNKLK